MDIDVGRFHSKDTFVRGQHTVNDRGIGLCSAWEKINVSRRAVAGLTNLTLGLLAPFVKTIRRTLEFIGFYEVLEDKRMCSIVVVAFK